MLNFFGLALFKLALFGIGLLCFRRLTWRYRSRLCRCLLMEYYCGSPLLLSGVDFFFDSVLWKSRYRLSLVDYSLIERQF